MGIEVSPPLPAIPKGTYYLSIPGVHWINRVPGRENAAYNEGDGRLIIVATGISVTAAVNLPHGAVVTAVKVYGSGTASAETWTLHRGSLTTYGTDAMASANINTEDNSINNATIDNTTYCYFFWALSLDGGDEIYGARITYTL